MSSVVTRDFVRERRNDALLVEEIKDATVLERSRGREVEQRGGKERLRHVEDKRE